MTPLDLLRRSPASTIHVAVCTDRAYLPHAAAMVHSLVENGGSPLHLHLVADDDVGDDLAGLVGELCAAGGAGYTLHRVAPERRAGLAGTLAPAAWNRFFLPELLPNLDRVIFCDADVLVCDSLRELWERDLEGNALGAVTVNFPFEEWALRHCEALGLGAPRDYFSAGVMLIDLGAWRELDATTRLVELARTHEDHGREALEGADSAAVVEYIAANPRRWVFYDQDVLNAELADRRLALEPRWDAMNQVLTASGEAVYGEREARAARERPAIRHFEGFGAAKPWDPRAPEAHRSHYWRHRNATAWGVGSELPHPMEEFFAGLREQRRERYAGRARRGGRAAAIVTIVQNEPVILPIWLRYYSRYFAAEDIYVLDHETERRLDRRATASCGYRSSHDRVDHTWMVETIEGSSTSCSSATTTVLVTDVDEIVAPDPARHARRLPRPASTRSSSTASATSDPPDRPGAGASTPSARSSTSAATGSPTTPTTSRRSRRSR